jgi:sigma-E factor negative regulatory protein RseA
MTDSVKEQLSACLDGQLPKAELDLLLKRAGKDEELQQALGRYALVSHALQAKSPAAASQKFARNVMAAIEAEPASSGRAPRFSAGATRWLRPVAGLAVAAGVATLAILALQPPTETQPEIVAANPVVSDDAAYVVPPAPNPATVSLIPATRLTNYVVAHSEYSSPLGRRTVLSGVLADDVEPVEGDVDPDADADAVAGQDVAQ